MGKVYESKYAAFQVLVRGAGEKFEYGTRIPTHSELTAEFGVFESEYAWDQGEGADGKRHVNLRGYIFDLDQQAEEKGWDETEKRLVDQQLEILCKKEPTTVWLRSVAAPVAPWPTYDDTHHLQVSKLASAAGLLDAALAYEQATKNREGVLKMLEVEKEKVPAEDTEDALTAA